MILGPTAVGKSSLAMALAQRFPLEIVNADALQVYRGLDIGTAKPSLEDRRRVREAVPVDRVRIEQIRADHHADVRDVEIELVILVDCDVRCREGCGERPGS